MNVGRHPLKCLKCCSSTLILTLLFFSEVASGLCISPDSQKASKAAAGTGYTRLGFHELQKLALLDNTEIPPYDQARSVVGISFDPTPSSPPLTVIAGVIEREEFQGYVKVMRKLQSGKYEIIFKRLYDGTTGYFDILEPHRLSQNAWPSVLVAFSTPGSTFANAFNLLLWYQDDCIRDFSVNSPGGRIKVRDLDDDGIEEVILHEYANPEAPAPGRMAWFSVYSLEDRRLVDRSQRYPNFYRDLIQTYYERRIAESEKLLKRGGSEYLKDDIIFSKHLIERARRLIGNK